MKFKLLLIFLFLIAFGTSYVLLDNHLISSRSNGISVTPSVTDTEGISKYKKGDINRDGKIDGFDKHFIENELGCSMNSSCWNKVIGKTMDGDNPIYVSDLDLNKDGKIDNLDLELVR